MRTINFLIIAPVIAFYSCTAQTEKNQKGERTVTTNKENPGTPKVKIKVNKKYDKKGNLISYDSAYSSYYASRKGDTALIDSLFKQFKPFFSQEYPFTTDKQFNTLFFNDTLLYNDFFHEDFFRKRFELNNEYMEKMMKQMDSVKNEFFKKQGKKLNKYETSK